MFRVLRVFVVLCILLFVSSCQKDSILKNEGSLSPVATESTMSVMPSSKDKLDEFKPEDRFTGQWLDGKKLIL